MIQGRSPRCGLSYCRDRIATVDSIAVEAPCLQARPFPYATRAKIVVRMQHRPTTSRRKCQTPKKAAVACLFRFTQPRPRRRLPLGNWLQSIVAVLGAFEVGLILQRWGSS